MQVVLNGEDGLECEVYIDGIRVEHVSEHVSEEGYRWYQVSS